MLELQTRIRRLTVLVALGLAAAATAQQQPPETFTGQVFVRETELVVDLPDTLEKAALTPGDFRVLVDGQPREVTRVERIQAAEAPWTFVIYVDRVLAQPATVFYSVSTLAERAARLTGLGTVQIVVAGSDPQVVLSATRDAALVERTLAGLTADARLQRDKTAKGPDTVAPPPPEPAVVHRQLDKLVTFLADGRSSGPRLVFLVADAVPIPQDQMPLLESDAPAAAAASPATAFRAASRLLAGYGWLTVPTALRVEEPGRTVTTQSDIDRFRVNSAPSADNRNGPPPAIPFRGSKPTPLRFPEVVDLSLEPQTASLRVLARATAGTVLGYEPQVDPLLAALGRRWRVWYAAPDTVDGKLRPVEVRLTRDERQKKDVRAPQWVRSSTPEGVAESRLANLLSGGKPDGGLPLTATADEGASGLTVQVQVAPFQVAAPAPPGPVRISYAFVRPDGSLDIRHETLAAEGVAAKGLRHTLQLKPPAGTRQVVLTVDDLSSERWGGAVLPVGSR